MNRIQLRCQYSLTQFVPIPQGAYLLARIIGHRLKTQGVVFPHPALVDEACLIEATGSFVTRFQNPTRRFTLGRHAIPPVPPPARRGHRDPLMSVSASQRRSSATHPIPLRSHWAARFYQNRKRRTIGYPYSSQPASAPHHSCPGPVKPPASRRPLGQDQRLSIPVPSPQRPRREQHPTTQSFASSASSGEIVKLSPSP